MRDSRALRWMRRLLWPAKMLRDGWLIVGLALLMLVLLNAALVALLPATAEQTVVAGARTPNRLVADAFASEDDARRYYVDHEHAREMAWRPFVYWRRQPVHTTMINVDSHGFRQTPGGPAVNQPALEVWAFGGSVMWGTGVGDAQTIPALLQENLARDLRTAVRVRNFAESGYVAQQSLLAFQNALRCGAQPDAVVFLDGVNDVFAAVQSGRAGAPQNEGLREREFLSSRRIGRWIGLSAGYFEGFARLLAPARPINAGNLAEQVVDQYVQTTQQMRALSEAAGSVAVIAWQPNLFQKPQHTHYEQAAHDSALAAHAALQRSADALIASRAGRTVLDLSALFADDAAPIFIDYAHVTLAGNTRIAQALAAPLRMALRDRTSRVAPESCAELPLL